jgi:hypothetical protein
MKGVSMFLLLPFVLAFNSGQSPEAIKAEHAKQYSDYHTGVDIGRETRAGNDVVRGMEIAPPLYAFDRSENLPKYPDPGLRSIACVADAIILGLPISAETGVTEAGDFLFTDYVVSVKSIIKARPPEPLIAGSRIVITRPGGETKLNGHEVRMTVANFPLLESNQQYLLFLRYLPETNTYRAFRSGTFILTSKGGVAPIDNSAQKLGAKSSQRQDAFLTEVRAAVSAPCSGVTPTLN